MGNKKKKGFLHVTEAIIVVMLIFIAIFQFNVIPRTDTQWEREKLQMLSYDLIYSLHEKGINWFDRDEVTGAVTSVLNETVDFALKTGQEVRPMMKVGCVCDPSNFTILEREILTGFDLNGLRRSFEVEWIDPAFIKFPSDADVVIFWGYQDLSATEQRNLMQYLERGNGLVEFSGLEEYQTGEAWHQEVFDLIWVSDSSYTPTPYAGFPIFLPTDTGYKVWKYYFHTPYEISPDDSMVGFWRMNVGKGGTARDNSGNGNDAGLYSGGPCVFDYNASECPVWTDGVLGYALDFDGDDDYVYLPSGGGVDFDGESAITIEAWLKPRGSSGSNYAVELPDDPATGGRGPGLNYESGDIQFHMVTGGGSSFSDVTVAAGTGWHHYVLTYDGTELRGYRDGQLAGSHPLDLGTGIKHASGEMNIGRFGDFGGGLNYNGGIDEVVIYDRVLEPGEISELYDRRFESASHRFTSFVGEKVYPNSGSSEKIIAELESVYSGGMHDGMSVPLASINWGVRGNGRAAWMSSAPLTPENKHLLKSLVMWTAGQRPYDVVAGEIKEGVEASLTTVLDSDMYEIVSVDMTIGYRF
jgi:hypothetical protein